jgi:hypothetical protein
MGLFSIFLARATSTRVAAGVLPEGEACIATNWRTRHDSNV